MIVVPQSFLQNSDTKKLLREGLNCVVYKEANKANPNNDRHLTTHAITYVLSGILRVESDSGWLSNVNAGDAIFLPKGLYMISDIIPKDDPFKAVVFFFDDDVVKEFFESYQNKIEGTAPSSESLILRKNQQLIAYTDSILKLYNDTDTNNPVTRHKLIELLMFLVKSSDGIELMRHLAKARARIQLPIGTFMDQNFDKPLKIEDYATLTGRSISSFHRDFKRLFDVGPKKWLTNKRMEKAKLLLEEKPDYNVTQISIESGYTSLSNFIKAFNTTYGISPKQYQIEKRKSISV